MEPPLRNLTFRDVQNLPLFTALKRESRFKGWFAKDDDRYCGLQSLCNDIIQSVNMEAHLIRNENQGPINGYGDTDKMFVADDQAWQIIRDWLLTEGLRRNWW